MGTRDAAVEHSQPARQATVASPERANPAALANDAPATSAPPAAMPATSAPPTPRMVDRTRAQAFGQALAALLGRQGYYDDQAKQYQLTRFYERLRARDGRGIRIAALRSYLRGEALPNEAKARLLADALNAPRGLLLYVAGYLTPHDLAHYPGPQLTLAAIEADIAELAELPLAPATQMRIIHDLRASAHILALLGKDQDEPIAASTPAGAVTHYLAAPDERETLIAQLVALLAAPTPPPFAETAEPSESDVADADAMEPAARKSDAGPSGD